jgi:hypothetical protein
MEGRLSALESTLGAAITGARKVPGNALADLNNITHEVALPD